MTLSFREAKEIAQAKETGLLVVNTIEKPYGWYFHFQPEEYVRTGDIRYMLVGSGGFIVEKDTGRIYEFGSAYPLEENFRRYELGFKYEFYDLYITKALDFELAVLYLDKLMMRYPVEGTQYGELYTQELIRIKLNNLPCLFRNQKFYFRIEVLELMQKSRCALFVVRQHISEESGQVTGTTVMSNIDDLSEG